jgi:hypothetical protein
LPLKKNWPAALIRHSARVVPLPLYSGPLPFWRQPSG